MAILLVAWSLAIVSGVFAMFLDIKKIADHPSTFWLIGSIFGVFIGFLLGASL